MTNVKFARYIGKPPPTCGRITNGNHFSRMCCNGFKVLYWKHIYTPTQIYGVKEKILTDNGGEFANSQFLHMCNAMNITVTGTAVESPFSNGLVKRHNMIITNMLDKILKDQQLDLDIALSWCLNAKNSLANVHGFSSF